jgi:hypothetical protein
MGVRVEIASPCPVSWSSMSGDDRVRFCGQCRLNVYNLSELSEREARSFVEQADGRVCVRFYRRKDGTVLTSDCPVGRARRVAKRAIAVAAALLAALLGTLAVASLGRENCRASVLVDRVLDVFRGRTMRMVAGEMPPPPPPPRRGS